MPPTPRKSPAPREPRHGRDAVERLLMYWLFSTVLMVIIIVVLALFTGGALRAVRELEVRVAALEAATQAAAPRDSVGAADVPRRTEATREDEQQPMAPDQRPEASTAPPADRPPPVPDRALSTPAVSAPPSAPSAADIDRQLEQLLRSDAVAEWLVTDREAARALTQLAAEHIGSATWGTSVWARLALLARLIERDALAGTFARRAAAAGDPLVAYARASALTLLARGRDSEALIFARQLAERSGPAPEALVLLGVALLANEQPGAAADAVGGLAEGASLPTVEKLRLGRVWLALENWEALAAVLETISGTPDMLVPEFNFLYAVSAAHAGRAVEAEAVFDYLAANPDVDPTPAGAAWPVPHPDAYEVLVWQGVARMQADQPEAAREALERAARRDPGRPEAYYRRGVLEYQQGNLDVAREYLNNAVASAAGMVPAREALAVLEMEANDVARAVEHLEEAVRLNPRRAAAHFLLAVAHAKLSQAEPAAEALRWAFRLEPEFLEQALQTEVLLRLFTEEQLAGLAEVTEESAAEGGAR